MGCMGAPLSRLCSLLSASKLWTKKRKQLLKKIPPIADLPESDPGHPVKLILMDIIDVKYEQTFSNLAAATSTTTGPRTEAGKKDIGHDYTPEFIRAINRLRPTSPD